VARFKAYLSEPITRCTKRERGRIVTLIGLLEEAIKAAPFHVDLYVPSRFSDPTVRQDLKPEHVYLLDRLRIVEADLLLVLADHTSFGVGGEVQMATELSKPIIMFSREKQLSRFLLGTPANAVRALYGNAYSLQYKEWRDLKQTLLPTLKEILDTLEPLTELPEPGWNIAQTLKQHREEAGLSLEDLAQKTKLPLLQLKLWETDFDALWQELSAYQRAGLLDLGTIQLHSAHLEQLTGPSIHALHRIAAVLGLGIHELVGDTREKWRNKGPSQEEQEMTQQYRQWFKGELRRKCLSFDVTFREYTALEETFFAERFPENQHLGPRALKHNSQLSDQAFLEALKALRHATPPLA
jgi:transcriptional regulator with XRE-family HTH domain